MKLKQPCFVRITDKPPNNYILGSEGTIFSNLLKRKFSESNSINLNKDVSLENLKIDLSGIYWIDAVNSDKYPKTQYIKLKKPFYTLVNKDGEMPKSMSWALHKNGK